VSDDQAGDIDLEQYTKQQVLSDMDMGDDLETLLMMKYMQADSEEEKQKLMMMMLAQ